MRAPLKIATLVAALGIVCGFNRAALDYDLNALRGQPVGAVIARLGPPIQKGFINGNNFIIGGSLSADATCVRFGGSLINKGW